MAYSVLYVDDDGNLQNVIRKVAEFVGGITVTAEPSATRALDLLASGSFDAVIAGHLMQEIDGVAFLQAVRSRFGDIPFVLLSPTFDTTMAADAVRKGATSVHFIPFPLPEFREIVRELTAAIGRRRGEMGEQCEPVPGQGVTPAAPSRKGGAVFSPAPVSGFTGPQAREPGEWEERFRVLAENVPNAVLLMDEGLRIRYASPQVLWEFGKHLHLQITGKTPAEIGLSDHVVRFWKDAVGGVFSSGKPREIEFRLREDSKPVCWTLAPVHGPDGSVSGVLAVDRWKTDLADETSAREFLIKINLLNGINRHDILNQATVMAANLEMIRHISGDPRIPEFCDRIRKAIDIICERINASRFYLDIVPRELRWQEVAAVLAPMKVPDGIRLEVVPPLPAVFADVKLPVVFSSIIRYIGKYSGGVSRVRVSAEETPDDCVIRIEDNGTGIPEEEKKRIFNHSYSDHRDFDIGDAAWILSETHIGIRENGTPGKGTRFEITVPKGWYTFGSVPAQPGAPPAPAGGKTE